MNDCKECGYLRDIGKATQETALARKLEIEKLRGAMMTTEEAGRFVRDQLWEVLNVVGYPARGELIAAPKKVVNLINRIADKWAESLSEDGERQTNAESEKDPASVAYGDMQFLLAYDGSARDGRMSSMSSKQLADRMSMAATHAFGKSVISSLLVEAAKRLNTRS